MANETRNNDTNFAVRINPDNHGELVGRLARDPQINTNKDGSTTVLATIMVRRTFARTELGKRVTADAINVQYFGRATDGKSSAGAFAYAKQGSYLKLMTHQESNQFEGKDGQIHYVNNTIVDNVQFLETRSTTQARAARAQAEAVPAEAPVEAVAAETSEEAEF